MPIMPAVAAEPGVQRPMIPGQQTMPDDNGNPLVAEIDRAHSQLSEPAKQAISILGQKTAASEPSPLISPAVPAAPLGPLPRPYVDPTVAAHKAELARLTTGDTGKPGVDQISQHHGKALSILGHLGDIVESTFLPRAAMFTPGTTLNHSRLVGNAEQAVTNDETQANNASKRGLEHAQQLNQESLPELNAQKIEAAEGKAQAIRDVGEARAAAQQAETGRKTDADKANYTLSLAKTGHKLDENGNVVALPYEELSQEQQAVYDLKHSQAELADATKAYKDAQTKNAPTLMKLAQQRIDNASRTSAIAKERLGLSEKQFELKVGGEDEANAHPGQLVDQGKTVGTAFQQNVRPTGQERNKADLANSAHDQIEDIKSIVKNRPDIFGPAAGRKTDFTVWLGSQDPDAQRFRAARTIAGDHLAGVFGGRSEAALQALDSAIGHFKDNPAALEAGLDQLQKANTGFQKAGTVPRANQAPKRPNGVPANAIWNPQSRHWEAP